MYISLGSGGMGYFTLLGALSQISYSDVKEISGASAGSMAGSLFIVAKGHIKQYIRCKYKLTFWRIIQTKYKNIRR